MNTSTIQVFERNVYGRPTIYPTGDHADAITGLTGKKSIIMSDLRHLQSLGHEIEFVPDPESAMARHALTL